MDDGPNAALWTFIACLVIWFIFSIGNLAKGREIIEECNSFGYFTQEGRKFKCEGEAE